MPTHPAAQPNDDSDKVYRLTTWLLTMVFLLFGIALCAASTMVHADLPAHLLRDAGIAFLIGVYLMLTLERINKSRVKDEVVRYMREVGENFVAAVYGKELPTELFDVIRRSLFTQSFVKSDHSVQYTLHDFGDAWLERQSRAVRKPFDDFRKSGDPLSRAEILVVLETAIAYQVTNVTRSSSTYAVMFDLPMPFGGRFPGLCGITAVRIGGKDEITGEVFCKSAEGGSDPTFLRFVKRVSVPAGGHLKIAIESYSLRKSDDREPFQTFIPSDGMNVVALDADGNKEIVVSLDAPLLGDNPEFVEKNTTTNRASLNVTQYLLPYQGITVSWMPERKANVATLAKREVPRSASNSAQGTGEPSTAS